MKLIEKTISKEYIFEGSVIKLRKDKVLLPNDKEAEREVVEHPGGVCVVAITDKREVIMVRQYRRPFDEIIEEIPAGKLSIGEDHYECGVRELEEETGYRAKNFKYLGGFYITPGFCNEIIHVYLATDLYKGESHPDDDEFLEVYLEPLEVLVNKVLKGEIKDAKTTIGILMANNLCN